VVRHGLALISLIARFDTVGPWLWACAFHMLSIASGWYGWHLPGHKRGVVHQLVATGEPNYGYEMV